MTAGFASIGTSWMLLHACTASKLSDLETWAVQHLEPVACAQGTEEGAARRMVLATTSSGDGDVDKGRVGEDRPWPEAQSRSIEGGAGEGRERTYAVVPGGGDTADGASCAWEGVDTSGRAAALEHEGFAGRSTLSNACHTITNYGSALKHCLKTVVACHI